ncbi:hypothetical protein [Desulfotruncus alcoholivorax]|uniref:hypothetical protein n=1 Tax=Desulfotruncus alcoholivorax TaxID=265477 RepID=UPI00041D4C3F|nr:hypothetical protein [Desulfotruncus alcoholivorax]
MVDIMDKIQNIKEIGKSTREKQQFISVSEIFNIWDIMVAKLDQLESIQIIENFIDDVDLRYISGKIVAALQTGINHMEQIMDNYGVPFPARPPAGVNTPIKMEYINDRDIYQSLYESIQSFFPILAAGYMQSTTPKIIKAIKNHMLLTMELHELLVEYGKFKGYLNLPPNYNT